MKGLDALAAMFVIQFGLLWARAVVILAYVRWFIAPTWNVPPLSVAAVMGLQLLLQALKPNSPHAEDKRSNWRRVAEGTIESLATSGLLWLSGAIIAYVGGGRS